MRKRNHTNVNGQGVGKASLGNTTVNDMNNSISTFVLTHAKDARNNLLAWTHSTVIVRLTLLPIICVCNLTNLRLFLLFVVRSEGGAECRKIQDELTTASSGTESANDSSAAAATAVGTASNGDTTMKPDPDGSWTAMNGNSLVM